MNTYRNETLHPCRGKANSCVSGRGAGFILTLAQSGSLSFLIQTVKKEISDSKVISDSAMVAVFFLFAL